MSTNNLPPSLISNLQNVLVGRKAAAAEEEEDKSESNNDSSSPSLQKEPDDGSKPQKPVVLVTNCDGIGSPGLTFLVEALVLDGSYDVHVCAPEMDKSNSGHSVTRHETLVACSAEVNGANAFEVSGTPVDCVSLALSGALFSWSRPALVVSGINKGPCCGNYSHYSGAFAGAREALLCGVPSLTISLNWMKDESKESDFKDAVNVCLPLIHAAVKNDETGTFPKNCLLNIEIPSSPSAHKGFKVTKQSMWGPALNWKAVSANRNPASAGQFMSMHQSLGVQLAQLSRDASAAGAARHVAKQKKNVEVESVGAAGKSGSDQGVVKKYFRLEFGEKIVDDVDEDFDFKAVQNGFVAVTPLQSSVNADCDIQASTSDWLTTVLAEGSKEEAS